MYVNYPVFSIPTPQRSLMTFEEDALDQAYRNLEATEKFCETGKKLSSLFTGQGTQDKLSPHMRLFRKSIVADCLLFESILVFLKQSMTSYVKGGYILRKAWKMYEKIFQETEELCSLPSPSPGPARARPPTGTLAGRGEWVVHVPVSVCDVRMSV